jgi:hypothetical protein
VFPNENNLFAEYVSKEEKHVADVTYMHEGCKIAIKKSLFFSNRKSINRYSSKYTTRPLAIYGPKKL